MAYKMGAKQRNKDTRWKQRFENFENAYIFLKKAVEQEKYDDLQAAGLVQSFEFTFELAWKTLKDYLELQETSTQSPRDAIKAAFASNLITDGHLWIQMLDKTNELTHTYNDAQAKRAVDMIRNNYYSGIEQVYATLKSLM